MKEPSTLPDIQLVKDLRGIALDDVGINNFILPLNLVNKSGRRQTVTATAALTVSLDAALKGTHMSRLVTVISDWSKSDILNLNILGLLEETTRSLHSDKARVELQFRYFAERLSPVTKIACDTSYLCSLQGVLKKSPETSYHLVIGLQIPVSTLCPCSKAISKHGAHNQRSIINAKLAINTESLELVNLEELISSLEDSASCPVYPLLKRVDEKYVTERQYENPKFVEDVVRDAALILRENPGVLGFSLQVTSEESIHAHNATASYQENFDAL